MSRLRVFLELFTLASFLATGFWARRRWGRDGVWLYFWLLALGLVRESYVVFRRILYGYADLALMLGAAPAIGAVIWGFSIVAALAAAEAIARAPVELDRPPAPSALGLVALFMIALAGFYEPFLARVEMARWEPGTATVLGVPAIALVGYPSFAVLVVGLGAAILARCRRGVARLAALAAAVPALALGHAWALDRLKAALGW